MNTNDKLLPTDSTEANKAAGGDCISRLVLPSSIDVERVTVKREVIPVKADSLDEAFQKARTDGKVLTESETVEYIIKDYPKDH